MSRAASPMYSEAAPRRRSPRGVGVPGFGRRAQDPRFELVVQGVRPRLQRPDLRRERPVVEQERRVREADGGLGEVLQLHEDVHGAVKLREGRRLLLGRRREGWRAGQLADVVHALLGPRISRTSPTETTSSGPGSKRQSIPLRIATTHIPDSVGSERSRSDRRLRGVVAQLHAGRHLVGVAEVLPQGVGIPSRAATTRAMSEAASPIPSIASAIHRTPAIPSASSAPRREHRGDPQEPEVVAHPLLEALDLLGELLLVEEHGRVREVHHQLGGVLQLDQEL